MIDPATLPDDTDSFTRWETILGARNASNSQASLTVTALHGNGAQLGDQTGCHHETTLAPQTGGSIVPCVVKQPEPGIAMLVLQASPGVLIQAEVQKARIRCGCFESLGCTALPQGQAVLPVFRGLFPTGSTAISGAIDLGTFDLPASCGTYVQQYRRRVNVTLFNGGDQPATFRVWETPNQSSAGELFSAEYTIGAKQILQINSFPVPTEGSQPLRAPNGGARIWINVTADQPFLSYVSTIIDNPERGAMPFQVYPGTIAD